MCAAEVLVTKQGFDETLTVIKGASHADVVDVVVEHSRHLQTLEL